MIIQITNAHAHLNQRKETNSHQVPRAETRQVPRVESNEPNQSPPCPMDNHTPNRLSDAPTARRRSRRNSLSHFTAKINLPAATPAMSTRSKVRVANEQHRVTCLRQPTKSSLKKIVGWPLLTEKNINKYYPETDKTPKGHMNQQRKNVRSTKTPFEVCNAAAALRGKKMKDIFVSTYDTCETSFSDQTGQFPKQSKRGHKYIMVHVEIDSNAILVEPMKS